MQEEDLICWEYSFVWILLTKLDYRKKCNNKKIDFFDAFVFLRIKATSLASRDGLVKVRLPYM